MSKKRRVPLLGKIEPAEERFIAPTLHIGVEAEKDRVLRRLAIDHIRPDFSQPRRILPFDLYERFKRGELDARQALQELRRRRAEGDLAASLILSSIEKLAASIAAEGVGLRHPINVYEVEDPSSPTGRSYRIGEGERRWWAYHWLVLEGDERARTIPVLIEGAPPGKMGVLARQQAENLARLKLPAVARARALARVKEALEALFEEAAQNPDDLDGVIARRWGQMPSELRNKLAQAGLGIRIPTGNELDELVGIWAGLGGNPISGRMVRGYLAILTLPPEALQLAEAAAIPEMTLRPIVALDDPSLQIELTRRVVTQGLSARETARIARQLVQRKGGQKKSKPLIMTLGRRFLPLAQQLEALSPTQLQELALQLVQDRRFREIYQAILALERLLQAVREAEASLAGAPSHTGGSDDTRPAYFSDPVKGNASSPGGTRARNARS